ncbi:MAG: PEP/pyruvate-binding domain-containing protein [Patescibacteria group bacterium]|nr:PEP/pyruvate-binding domain-containing protein [Patescibacteria group bacterium]
MKKKSEVSPKDTQMQRILFFDTHEKIDSSLLGGKGYSLARMTQKGLPVPYGFTMTTNFWCDMMASGGDLSDKCFSQIENAVNIVEKKVGKRLGDSDHPLTYSLRSGASVSMPGMMSTILNLGINDEILSCLKNEIGEIGALDAYQRLIRMYSVSVYSVLHEKFRNVEDRVHANYSLQSGHIGSAEFYNALIDGFKEIVVLETGHEFEQDLKSQLREGIKSICQSFWNHAAVVYRINQGYSHEIGTAVNFQEMVYGNTSSLSGTAVIFSRDIQTGENRLDGHYLSGAQGEAVVAGTTENIEPITNLPKAVREQIEQYLPTIEEITQGVADVEITWNDEQNLYILQSRKAKMSPLASVVTAIDMHKEGIIKSLDDALDSIRYDQISSIQLPVFEANALHEARQSRLMTIGEGLYTGIAVGKLYTDSDRAKKAVLSGEDVIYFCRHFDPNKDISLVVGWLSPDGNVKKVKAIVVTEGSPSSHMGLIISEAGLPSIMGCQGITLDSRNFGMKCKEKEYKEGTIISLDSSLGSLFSGEISIQEAPDLPQKIKEFIGRWEVKWGHDNPWVSFISKNANRASLEDIIAKVSASQRKAQKWEYSKSRQVELINSVFPKDMCIETYVLKSGDTDGIRSAVRKAKGSGFSVWPRSDGGDLLSPYVSSDLTLDDGEALEDWLCNHDSVHVKPEWGGLPQWIENGIEYVIIPFDPKGKLDKSLQEQHFVCTLRCVASVPPKIVIDINDKTCYLRSLGEARDETRAMQISVVANSQSQNALSEITINLGTGHFDPAKVELLLEHLKNPTNESLSSLNRKLKNIFNLQIDKLRPEKFKQVLHEMCNSGYIDDAELGLFVSERSFGVILAVRDMIFSKWWKLYKIPQLMWSLKEVANIKLLEFQGRYTLDKGLDWMLVYGTKGPDEEVLVKKALDKLE